MKIFLTGIIIFSLCFISISFQSSAQSIALQNIPINNTNSFKNSFKPNPLLVRKCDDFILTGDGGDAQWKKAEWYPLTQLDSGGGNYASRFKILYSPTGIYLLFNGDDKKIATQYDKDLSDMYNGDVFEAFFHPDPSQQVYFEYEINALNKDLVLLLSRTNRKGYSWVPWHYENERRLKKGVKVEGGKSEPQSAITAWSAEVFFPNELFALLPNVPPKSGSIWNANFCRLDYDDGKMIKWSWSLTIKKSFHELDQFLQIKFE